MSGERIKNAMTKLWKAMDTNGDGTVDVEECKKLNTEVQSKLTDAQKADPAFGRMNPESCIEMTKEIQEQTLASMASMPDELAKPMADMMEEIVSKLGNGESAATGGSEATSNGATGGSEATSAPAGSEATSAPAGSATTAALDSNKQSDSIMLYASMGLIIVYTVWF